MRLPQRTRWRKLKKLIRLVQTRRYRRGLRLRVAAAIEHEAAYLQHRPATILDVGANRGQFALFAAQRFPDAHLVCFEPLPGASSVLKRVLAVHPSAAVHEFALSATSGVMEFHQTARDDSSSLLPVTARQTEYFPDAGEVATIPVRV